MTTLIKAVQQQGQWLLVVNTLLADLVESDGYRPLLVIGQNIMVVMGRYIYLLWNRVWNMSSIIM